MKIPTNIITTGYTIGNEFIYPENNNPYVGYYYKINNSFFQGKVFNSNAPQIIKKENSNKLLNNPKTKTYSQIKGITSQQLESPEYNYLPFSGILNNPNSVRYFVKKVNVYPIIIKEVNEDTFQELSSDPFYQTISVNFINIDKVDELDKIMPGLKDFLVG
jgi:hypothetical protein